MLLVTLGDLSLDIVISPTAPIATGSDVSGTIAFRVGGSAANAARSFAALGGEAAFVGAVGDDALGRRLVRALRGARVRPYVVVVKGAPTPRIAVLLGARGERSFVTSRGAADHLAAAHLRRAWFDAAVALHLPAYSLLTEPLSSAARLAAGWARDGGALVSVDLASAAPLRALGADRARAAVATLQPDVLFANADEAAVFDGRLDDLAPLVVIKRGADGCDVGNHHVPAEAVEASDTTGAGDAFDAGFLLSWSADRLDVVAAARAGHAAAAALLRGPRAELEP